MQKRGQVDNVMEKDRERCLKQKQALFEAFDRLDKSDNESDPGREASEAALRRSNSNKDVNRSTTEGLHVPNEHALVSSDPVPSTDDQRKHCILPNPSTSNLGVGRPSHPDSPPSLQQNALDRPATTALSKNLGKRKRSNASRRVSEEQQIFRGLHFYFFPNNDIHPARRMRIAKAIEYGAVWCKNWNPNVSHVVLDKGIGFDSLTKFLKLESIPESISVVSENFPAECIAYHVLLDARLAQFAVRGYRPTKVTRPQVEPLRADSLQLKPSKRAITTPRPFTPSPGAVENIPSTSIARSPGHTIDPIQQDEHAADPETIKDSFPKSTTALDEAIAKAKSLRYLPLDDEDGGSRPPSSEGRQSDEGEAGSGFQLLKQQKVKTKVFQDKFQCMQKHTGETSGSPNIITIGILQQLADYYGEIGDEWRIRAYRKAIATLRNHPTKICTKEQALSLPNIGDRLATKIEEIAFTSRLRRLDSARAEPGDQVLQSFMKVYGAGFAAASKWVNQGLKTLDELLQKADLTANQRIGVEHYVDFNSRIPRAEVERHGNVVLNSLRKIDKGFEVIIGGSYRRGSSDSGDIDCIITRPHTSLAHIHNVVSGQLIPQLTRQGFLVAALATTSKDDGSKWHGASCLPGSQTWRRIDLLLVPSDELGAALIYFTGNDIFNRSLRLLASTKGMRLNQRGLYRDVIRGKGREKLTDGTLVEGKDERRIFEVLGVPWRPPEHRIC